MLILSHRHLVGITITTFQFKDGEYQDKELSVTSPFEYMAVTFEALNLVNYQTDEPSHHVTKADVPRNHPSFYVGFGEDISAGYGAPRTCCKLVKPLLQLRTLLCRRCGRRVAHGVGWLH